MKKIPIKFYDIIIIIIIVVVVIIIIIIVWPAICNLHPANYTLRFAMQISLCFCTIVHTIFLCYLIDMH